MTTESQELDLTQGDRIRKQTTEERVEHHHHGISDPAVHAVAGGAAEMGVHHHPQQSVFSRVGHFALHYLEMCLAMCIGGITLNVLFFTGAAQLGYTNLLERYPEFTILTIGILLAIAMGTWMRIRGHDWRMNLEMSSTSVILAVVLIGAFWLGAIPQSGMLEWIKRLACPVMLIPMLLRLDHYTGGHAAHARHTSPKPA